MGMNTVINVFDPKYTVGAVIAGTANSYVKPFGTVVIQNTASTTWYLNHLASTGSFSSSYVYWYYTRIA